ncbi:K+/H+ antiporter subunit F [Paracoccus sp. Z118]|uniref:K+/H+ antiporter subunit F n=1 Tax=Paracoccus sp. Z118 TaxID=2851017 RepID=UPI001C2B7861|nr:K+/H+ antiporter subunit F [Paracoccus sp. Z118]MBV0891333.1 K+/H+ antiporter subunit F [Paracoccus sp. Z118]
MIQLALWFAFGCFGLALLCCLYRVVFSNALTDRILALDTMTINVIAVLVLVGIAQGTTIYFEAAMLFAMFGFVSTVAFAKFLLRGDIIE